MNWREKISPVAIIAVAIVLAILVTVGIVGWVHPKHTQPEKVATASAAQSVASKPATLPAPAAMVDPTAPSAAQMQLAVVHKGEGVENALIRQLAADPVAYGFTGKQDDAKAVHQWAGRQAHLLAIKTGYYDWKFGAEVRVAAPDKMAYVIQKNDAGNLTVVEYTVKNPSQASPDASASSSTLSQGVTRVASATVGASNFFGASPVTGNKIPVPHGEYVYFPGVPGN